MLRSHGITVLYNIILLFLNKTEVLLGSKKKRSKKNIKTGGGRGTKRKYRNKRAAKKRRERDRKSAAKRRRWAKKKTEKNKFGDMYLEEKCKNKKDCEIPECWSDKEKKFYM